MQGCSPLRAQVIEVAPDRVVHSSDSIARVAPPGRVGVFGPAMAKPLVIVESPTKKKTIERFLGSEYMVEASVGHIRDLPANAKDIPEAAKKAGVHPDFAVNIEDGFKPYYIVPADKKKQVAELRALMKNASTVYLATDEDREGESISWHLKELLQPTGPVKRMVREYTVLATGVTTL